MKKTHYFCNLCGEEVQEHDTIKITVHLEEVTTETGLRPNATRLSGHLHRNCVKPFLFLQCSYRESMILDIPLKQEFAYGMPKFDEIKL